jgi:hypothetical protein
MAIKLLNKYSTKSVFTIIRIKKLVNIGIVPLSHYKFEEHTDDTDIDKSQGDEGDDIDEEQEEHSGLVGGCSEVEFVCHGRLLWEPGCLE